MKQMRFSTRTAATALLGLLLLAMNAVPVLAAGILPPHNPSTSLKPHPNFESSGMCSGHRSSLSCPNPCWNGRHTVYRNTATCNAFVMRAIDAARTLESLAAMTLPTNWYSLTVPEQLFVLADLERTSRGLPPYLGLNRALSNSAQRAAQTQSDPLIASGFAMSARWGFGSTLAIGDSTTLEADYGWMYDDGWGGSQVLTLNYTCTSPGGAGCWDHRDELLGSAGTYNPGVGLRCTTCEMGTAFAVVRGTGSFTDLVERPTAKAPAMYFTWAKNVVPYLHG